ncbi:MAG TPA: VWA domain-containing protein [Roseiflexaceae bacterium]
MFAALGSQPAQQYRLREPNIRLDVNLVLVPVNVTDQRGATVTGLDRGQFQIFEDRIRQPIVSFSREDSPVSVGVVFDLSGSMKNKIDEARRASAALFRTANPGDEAFLIAFATRPETPTGFTSDTSRIQAGLGQARAHGSTALVDAVYLALNRMRKARNQRRALVVISDGMDNHSRYTKAELRSLALETDVQIYTVAIFEPARDLKPIQMDQERAGVALLEDLSRVTGGLHFALTGAADIPPVAARIGTALHNVYVIGYRPPGGIEGYRRIQVKATVKNLRLAARPGYYAASAGLPPPREERVLRP